MTSQNITQQEIEKKLVSLKPKLEKEFGVSKIGYFGSFARGDYTEASDLDLLVDFSRKIGWKFFDLKDYLESQFDRKVDLVTERSIKPKWREAILNQTHFV